MAETQANFKVSAKIARGCSIGSTSQQLNFGRYAALSNDLVDAQLSNALDTWNIQCTEKIPVKISLDAGEYASAGWRRMKHSVAQAYIPYALYQDSAHQQAYVANQNIRLERSSSNGNLLQFSIFAVVDLANSTRSNIAGLYQDNVAITIAW
ncbi:hypothetical protein BFG52_00900 [Acinetobacter larvae]|uniref:Spore coat protein U/FanG domain-containing protein n=2 Tax=Acinetobacter larvae TaxID=1789224 RepID=A0A1B2M3R4_9GAMM|nr:hypothetical protein BFG52_00900 [Acinetobacter larvae]